MEDTHDPTHLPSLLLTDWQRVLGGAWNVCLKCLKRHRTKSLSASGLRMRMTKIQIDRMALVLDVNEIIVVSFLTYMKREKLVKHSFELEGGSREMPPHP